MTRQVGDPSGFGRYAIVDRDWSSVLCHECGQWLESVGAHIGRAHDMTAAQYRREHGLSRSQPLICERLSAEASARSRQRLDSDGWARLEAARDPRAASAAREPAGWTGALPAAARAVISAQAADHLPRRPRRTRTCPVCGVQHQRRKDSCGAPACVTALRAAAARRQMSTKYRQLTDEERTELTTAGKDLGTVVRRLQADGVSSAAIGRTLGRSGAWMTKHFPLD